MNILEHAENGTYWKRIIYDIVSQEAFNPWDIDVGILADSYMQKVKEIKMVDFEVPGTVVLVGSVLLKLKSDIVSGQTYIFEENLSIDGENADMDDVSADLDELTAEEIPRSTIEPKVFVRRIPKRKVTLQELIVFLKRVITQVEKKDIVRTERGLRRVEVQVSKKNVERVMREVFRDIQRLAKGQKTTFKELVDEWNKERVVAYLIPVLHLANKEKISVEQETMFGDIFISPM